MRDEELGGAGGAVDCFPDERGGMDGGARSLARTRSFVLDEFLWDRSVEGVRGCARARRNRGHGLRQGDELNSPEIGENATASV